MYTLNKKNPILLGLLMVSIAIGAYMAVMALRGSPVSNKAMWLWTIPTVFLLIYSIIESRKVEI